MAGQRSGWTPACTQAACVCGGPPEATPSERHLLQRAACRRLAANEWGCGPPLLPAGSAWRQAGLAVATRADGGCMLPVSPCKGCHIVLLYDRPCQTLVRGLLAICMLLLGVWARWAAPSWCPLTDADSKSRNCVILPPACCHCCCTETRELGSGSMPTAANRTSYALAAVTAPA